MLRRSTRNLRHIQRLQRQVVRVCRQGLGENYTLPTCTGDASTCNVETCCEAVAAEDSCFPGEAEVSVQDRSRVRVDKLEVGTSVVTEGGLEAVVGMLHLHSEVPHVLAQATAVSV